MADVIRVRAPASSANVGPGFDCVGIALELWNELEISPGSGVAVHGEGADEVPADARHLGLRAFATLAPLAGHRFEFHNRIPFERGLGSSAATIALGLVAAAAVAALKAPPDQLLQNGLQFEDHPDNLAPALLGGACLAWHGLEGCAARRISDGMPLAPVVVIPPGRVATAEARSALPGRVPFADAAHTAGRAAMLGAAIGRGDAELLAAALDDRLHEPYRAALSSHFDAVRSDLPTGARAATISGSGPTTIVWTEPELSDACCAELAARFPEARVLVPGVSARGAEVVE